MPDKVYRLRCGRRRHSHWLADEQELRRVAVEKDLASIDDKGRIFMGPLVWVEEGLRQGKKTVPLPPPSNAPRHLLR